MNYLEICGFWSNQKENTKKMPLEEAILRDTPKLQVEMTKTPHATSKSIFENAGVPKIEKNALCQTLKSLAKEMKPIKQPPLSKRHKTEMVEWAHRYMKTDFRNVLFTDECHPRQTRWLVLRLDTSRSATSN